jgi:hypothetical protein
MNQLKEQGEEEADQKAGDPGKIKTESLLLNSNITREMAEVADPGNSRSEEKEEAQEDKEDS